MLNIVQVRKAPDGDITHVLFDNGEAVTINEAIHMAKENQIDHVVVGKTKNGHETLRSSGNNTQADNLTNLPQF